jgi:cytochrome c553
MNSKLKFSAAIMILVFTAMACQHKSNLPAPAAPNNDTTTNTTDTTICFERDILPIFQSNCAKGGCHDAASHEKGYVLDSYNNIMNTGDDDGIVPGSANESEIYQSLIDGDLDDRMPLYPNPALSTSQISLIRRWINEGAPNGTNCATLCDTTNITFSAGIQPMMQQNCVGCHSASLASGGVNLSTHAGVAAAARNNRLVGAMKHQSGFVAMPQGAAKLSDCKIKQVEKWVQAGALNN